MKKIKTYAASELQVKSSDIYNTVMIDKAVFINHRSRPDMVLIDREYLELILTSDVYRAVANKELARRF